MKVISDLKKTLFYYNIDARIQGERWQQFTGVCTYKTRQPVSMFVDHCKVHFKAMPYEYRLRERILDTYKCVIEKGGELFNRHRTNTRFCRTVILEVNKDEKP